MKLSTRLILLIVGCLLPIVTAQIYSQTTLSADRQKQLHATALQQASLASTSVANIIDSVHQLGTAVQQFPEMRDATGHCEQHLNSLRQALLRYRFLALFSPSDGRMICGSDGAESEMAGADRTWLAALLATHDFAVGELVLDPGASSAYLPVGVYLPSRGAAHPAILLAALDVGWISRHLESALISGNSDGATATLLLADHDGTIISRTPDSGHWIGQQLPKWLMPLITRAAPGDEVVSDKGHPYLAAYMPSAVPPRGMTIISLFSLPELTTDIDRATLQDLLVICGAALIALILAWIAGRKFIYRPTESLLQAARKWREGDLAARADLTEAGSEFALLAQSFNAMAAGLAARETERRMQASFLEAQVAERTRELSETNNRLQVEIAGREKTEAALHQAQKLQAVGQLAGGIAHDFNNLLATVLGNLELMERRVEQASEAWAAAEKERLLRLIERAVGAVQRGSQLTSRLLAFSRRQRLAARPTDVNSLLQELITLATSTLGRRVQVTAELDEQLWPAMVDPSQVEAAILNLCLNARDAMPEGGKLTIHTRNITVPGGTAAEPMELVPGDYVQIAISDTGVGMSPDVKARAFEPFFTTKGPGAGSGLGLSQVYGLARQSGGAVSIESATGEGTRVTLSLPRAAIEAPSSDAPAEEEPIAAPASGTPDELILVVDDDHAVRQVTVEMARDLGFEVAQAAGGDQALGLLDKLSPSPAMILLDYAMPGMNGLQLARALRERGVTAPIALVTGYAELSEADIQGGELAGLLRKPFTIRELQMLLKQLRASAEATGRLLEPGVPAR